MFSSHVCRLAIRSEFSLMTFLVSARVSCICSQLLVKLEDWLQSVAAYQLYNVGNWVTCISSFSREAQVCSHGSQDSKISQSMKVLRTMLKTGTLSHWPHSAGQASYKTNPNLRDGNINFTSWWKEMQSHSNGMCHGRAENCNFFLLQSTKSIMFCSLKFSFLIKHSTHLFQKNNKIYFLNVSQEKNNESQTVISQNWECSTHEYQQCRVII